MTFTTTTRKAIGMTVLGTLFIGITLVMVRPNVELQAREHQRAVDEQTLTVMQRHTNDLGRLAAVSMDNDANARFSKVPNSVLVKVHEQCSALATLRSQVASRVSPVYMTMVEESYIACSELGKTAQKRDVIYNDLLNLYFAIKQGNEEAERNDVSRAQESPEQRAFSNAEKHAASNIKSMGLWTASR